MTDGPGPAGSATPRSRPHTARWVAAGVLVVAAGLVAVLATRPPATATEVYSPLVGKPVPAVSGPTLAGSPYALAAPPGRFTVVNFFASWCAPCQQEGPELVRFQFEHQRAGDASMLSVLFEDQPDRARSYQATIGATWPTLVDGGRLAVAFGVRAPPSTFVVAPDGRVVAFLVAPVTAADLDQILARARAARA